MLDVHPPHHAANTWRDFLIHIATIVIGLLIAVGLEQTVEAIHHRHQRHQLVESLIDDTKKDARDSEEWERVIDLRSAWIKYRIAQVRTALASHQLLAVATPFPPDTPNVPDAPSWNAAESNGLLSVLSQDEVRSFGEAAELAIAYRRLSVDNYALQDKTRRFEERFLVFEAHGPGTVDRYDYSSASPADLKEYLDLLLTQQAALRRADLWIRYTRGADAAILEGSRNLVDIERSEGRFAAKSK